MYFDFLALSINHTCMSEPATRDCRAKAVFVEKAPTEAETTRAMAMADRTIMMIN
jgi:hypothetical protein